MQAKTEVKSYWLLLMSSGSCNVVGSSSLTSRLKEVKVDEGFSHHAATSTMLCSVPCDVIFALHQSLLLLLFTQILDLILQSVSFLAGEELNCFVLHKKPKGVQQGM